MKKQLLFLCLALTLMNCTHEQFQTYLLDNGLEERKPVHRDIETVPETNIPLSYGDEFASLKKVYTTPAPATAKLDKRNISVLSTAKKDLETFYVIAHYLRTHKKMEDLDLLEGFAREYMGEGIDALLRKEVSSDSPEVKKLLFELQYLKSLLLYELNDIVMACKTIRNLEVLFSQSSNVNVGFIVDSLSSETPHMVLTEFNHLCNENILEKIAH